MDVCFLCLCVVHGAACSGLCDELITREGSSNVLGHARVCVCVCVCGLETSKLRQPRPEMDCCATEKEEESFGWKIVRKNKPSMSEKR
jgi:hypothetical protein